MFQIVELSSTIWNRTCEGPPGDCGGRDRGAPRARRRRPASVPDRRDPGRRHRPRGDRRGAQGARRGPRRHRRRARRLRPRRRPLPAHRRDPARRGPRDDARPRRDPAGRGGRSARAARDPRARPAAADPLRARPVREPPPGDPVPGRADAGAVPRRGRREHGGDPGELGGPVQRRRWVPPQGHAPRGGRAVLGEHAARRGTDRPLRVRLRDAPGAPASGDPRPQDERPDVRGRPLPAGRARGRRGVPRRRPPTTCTSTPRASTSSISPRAST